MRQKDAFAKRSGPAKNTYALVVNQNALVGKRRRAEDALPTVQQWRRTVIWAINPYPIFNPFA